MGKWKSRPERWSWGGGGDPWWELSSYGQKPVSQTAGSWAATQASAEKQQAAAYISGAHTEAGGAVRTHIESRPMLADSTYLH